MLRTCCRLPAAVGMLRHIAMTHPAESNCANFCVSSSRSIQLQRAKSDNVTSATLLWINHKVLQFDETIWSYLLPVCRAALAGTLAPRTCQHLNQLWMLIVFDRFLPFVSLSCCNQIAPAAPPAINAFIAAMGTARWDLEMKKYQRKNKSWNLKGKLTRNVVWTLIEMQHTRIELRLTWDYEGTKYQTMSSVAFCPHLTIYSVVDSLTKLHNRP